VDDDPAEEDDDLEVDLEAVDVVSFALAVVSLGFNALASDSILAATAPVIQVCVSVVEAITYTCKSFVSSFRGGICRVPHDCTSN
jgi:hypothetical protein